MKKSILIPLISALLSFNLITTANPVTREEAIEIAISWYANMAGTSLTDYSIKDEFTLEKDNLVTMYIFNFKSGGFVIVAADDASIPVLGFSEENPFPADISCPAVKEWLEDYSVQIDQIRKKGLSNRETKEQWDAIRQGKFPEREEIRVGPLLTTKWGQGCYYNEMCPAEPEGPCGHAVACCAATAMAQIMKYHGFPSKGVGSYAYHHPVYGELSADFENTVYDWASMPDELISENIPVATLMYHAGIALNVYYGASLSDVFPDIAGKVFVDYFNYEPTIQMHIKDDYADPEDWKNLLRSDLDNQLPVLYCAGSMWDGHVFVCDGYSDILDMFHMNWGWDGDFDGWFAIDITNLVWPLYLRNDIHIHIKPNNPDLITRILSPEDHSLIIAGNSIVIEAATVRGIADRMKLMIDGTEVAAGTSNSLSYTWNTDMADIGTHEIISWSYSGNDSVYHPHKLCVTDTWMKQSSGFPTKMIVNYISAIDSNVVWAAAKDGGESWLAPCQAFTRTIDGGQTWIPGKIASGNDLTLSMIQGINAQKAYACMYSLSGNSPQIFVTADGGNTWEHQVSASFSSASSWAGCVHLFNENDGWCLGDPAGTNNRFEMFTTNNGGNNWIPVPVENIPPSLQDESSWPGGYSAFNDTIWFGTSHGRIFKSCDRGHTWSVMQVYETSKEYLIPVFRNGSQGLAFNIWGPQRLFETLNGGASWELVNYSGRIFRTALAYVPGTGNSWVSAGGMGFIGGEGASYSEDGGHTWTAFQGTEGVSFRHMAWISPQCGWAGSFNSSPTEGGVFKFTGKFSSSSAINDDHLNPFEFTIYPNPSSLTVTIGLNIPPEKNSILTISNLTGQQIIKRQITENQTVIETDTWPGGIYFVAVSNEGSVLVRKLVVR